MLALEDAFLGGTVNVLCSPPAQISGQPHFTVSQSEDGFEKVMQSVSLTLTWDIDEQTPQIVAALEIRRHLRDRTDV